MREKFLEGPYMKGFDKGRKGQTLSQPGRDSTVVAVIVLAEKAS